MNILKLILMIVGFAGICSAVFTPVFIGITKLTILLAVVGVISISVAIQLKD